MSRVQAYAGLRSVLDVDAGLQAWKGPLAPLEGNQLVTAIQDDQLPAILYELGDLVTSAEGFSVDQQAAAEFLIGIIWHEESPASAFADRMALEDLVVAAIRAKNTLNSSVIQASVEQGEHDKSVTHPFHVFRFSVNCIYNYPYQEF